MTLKRVLTLSKVSCNELMSIFAWTHNHLFGSIRMRKLFKDEVTDTLKLHIRYIIRLNLHFISFLFLMEETPRIFYGYTNIFIHVYFTYFTSIYFQSTIENTERFLMLISFIQYNQIFYFFVRWFNVFNKFTREKYFL